MAGLAIHTSNVINTTAWLTMIVHLTRLVLTKNVLIHVIASFVAVEPNARSKDTRQSVSVLLGCKEIRSYLVKRLAVNLTMIVLIERNAIILQVEVVGENVCHYVEAILVLKGRLVVPRIIKKSALAILL